jgi:flagellar hook-associated protein 1 FlgK
MAGLGDLLNIGASAALASQRAAQVTSNNVANASTPGYHTQNVRFASIEPNYGVTVAGVSRATDQLTWARLGDQAGTTAFAQARADSLAQIESSAATLGDGSLSSALDSFYASWRSLTADASDPAMRAQVVSASDQLATRVREAAAGLDTARTNIDTEIQDDVTGVNSLLDKVGALNRSIAMSEVNGSEASELRDQRDTAARSLAESVGATAITDKSGGMRILVGGVSLVQDGNVRHLATSTDAVTGKLQIAVTDGARTRIDTRLDSGQIGGLLDVRDNALTQATNELDGFAYDLATAVNTVHKAGVGLDGIGNRNLFDPPAAVTGAAASLSVAAAVDANPSCLAAAANAAGLPGDNSNATAMVDLESQNVAVAGTQTLSESLTGMINSVGTQAKDATDAASLCATRLTNLETIHDQATGVSTDEQMILLTRFQYAFEAASKIITTADEMLAEVLKF